MKQFTDTELDSMLQLSLQLQSGTYVVGCASEEDISNLVELVKSLERVSDDI